MIIMRLSFFLCFYLFTFIIFFLAWNLLIKIKSKSIRLSNQFLLIEFWIENIKSIPHWYAKCFSNIHNSLLLYFIIYLYQISLVLDHHLQKLLINLKYCNEFILLIFFMEKWRRLVLNPRIWFAKKMRKPLTLFLIKSYLEYFSHEYTREWTKEISSKYFLNDGYTWKPEKELAK